MTHLYDRVSRLVGSLLAVVGLIIVAASIPGSAQAQIGADLNISPKRVVFGPGERTGKFRLGTEELLVAEDGKSHISYEDFAVAVVDEIEAPKHLRQRFTVGY